MAFNVNDIKSALNQQNGVLRTSHFLVLISKVEFLKENDTTRIIPFFCDQAVLPGIGYQTNEIKPHGYGLYEKRPYQTMFRDLPLTFLVDGKGHMLRFFHKWAQNINNIQTKDTQKQFNGMKMFEFNYPENYQATIDIWHYDVTGNEVIHYQFERAWPTEINDITVDWADHDGLLKLNVAYSYRSWTSEHIQVGQEQVNESLRYNMPRVDAGISDALGGALINPERIASTINTIIAPIFSRY